ncbi:unnamed protein product [Rhizophagus irregularis]|nr:unnamed protein product [Rhizophagus irregularis]CAB5375312.1 unnamed protein product [Rhizophagus irregularis]
MTSHFNLPTFDNISVLQNQLNQQQKFQQQQQQQQRYKQVVEANTFANSTTPFLTTNSSNKNSIIMANEEMDTKSEQILNEKWDLCLSNMLIKSGIGLSVGIVASALLFKKKSWPIAMSTGFGIGVAYAECQRSFNPTAIPGIKIIKPSSSN